MRQVDDDARLGQRQGVERSGDDLPVQRWFTDPTRGVAEWIVEEHRPRRVRRGGDVSGAREAHGGDPCGFELACDQTHGLMTDRSNRDQQHGLDLVADAAFDQRRRQLLTNATLGVDAAHAGEQVGGQLADLAVGDHCA